MAKQSLRRILTHPEAILNELWFSSDCKILMLATLIRLPYSHTENLTWHTDTAELFRSSAKLLLLSIGQLG